MPPMEEPLGRLKRGAIYSSFEFGGVFCRIATHRIDRLMPALHTSTRKLEENTYAFWALECSCRNAAAEMQQQLGHHLLFPAREGSTIIPCLQLERE